MYACEVLYFVARSPLSGVLYGWKRSFKAFKADGLHISGISLPRMVTHVVELHSTTSPCTAISRRG